MTKRWIAEVVDGEQRESVGNAGICQIGYFDFHRMLRGDGEECVGRALDKEGRKLESI